MPMHVHDRSVVRRRSGTGASKPRQRLVGPAAYCVRHRVRTCEFRRCGTVGSCLDERSRREASSVAQRRRLPAGVDGRASASDSPKTVYAIRRSGPSSSFGVRRFPAPGKGSPGSASPRERGTSVVTASELSRRMDCRDGVSGACPSGRPRTVGNRTLQKPSPTSGGVESPLRRVGSGTRVRKGVDSPLRSVGSGPCVRKGVDSPLRGVGSGTRVRKLVRDDPQRAPPVR